MTNYIILLPPSETKKEGGDKDKPLRIVKNYKKYNYFEELNSVRENIYLNLINYISKSTFTELENLFELKGKNLQNAIEITLDLLNEETMQTIDRYQGTMFKSINYEKYNQNQKNNFNSSVIFIDALFGILKPEDRIPEYKLKISSKFHDIDITKYWKENLKEIFKILFKDKLIIDILPKAHRNIICEKDIENKENYIKINFMKKDKNNKIVNSAHESKKLKGELIEYLTRTEKITIEDLKNFKHNLGYEFSKELSLKNEIIYLKN